MTRALAAAWRRIPRALGATIALPMLMAVPLDGAASDDADMLGCTAPQSVEERFVAADCLACWQATPPVATGTRRPPVMTLDWVVPSSAGAQAPLAPAAIAEATARVASAGMLGPDETLVRLQPLPARPALRLRVEDGPGWGGYLAASLQLEDLGKPGAGGARGTAGLQAFLALVEEIPAGEDGSPVARRLVRSVVGPLPVDDVAPGHPVQHLRALRVPDTPRPERLRAAAWVETAQGRTVAAALRALPACKPAPAPQRALRSGPDAPT